MHNINKIEGREIRGRILKVLDATYPHPASTQLLSDTLTDAQYCCSPSQVKVHLAYLEEKGYVSNQTVEVEELDMRRDIARLTAKGKDLLEGNIPEDVGVKLRG